MFKKLLTATGLVALLATPAFADLGLVLPDRPLADDLEKTTLRLLVGSIDPDTGTGVAIERPQVLTALRYNGEAIDRSEHLSVIDEAVAFGARAWTTTILLPYPGVYQFIMQSKACWIPTEDKFVQYIAKVQVPAYDSPEGWDKPDNVSFEIMPLSRPFGMCTGMSFSGQALFDGKPVPGALIDVARLDPSIKPNISDPVNPNAPAQEEDTSQKARKPAPTPQLISTFGTYGSSQQLRADSQGVFSFACPLPGWWAFSTSMPSDTLLDPAGKQKPLEIKTTFWVYISEFPKPVPPKK